MKRNRIASLLVLLLALAVCAWAQKSDERRTRLDSLVQVERDVALAARTH